MTLHTDAVCLNRAQIKRGVKGLDITVKSAKGRAKLFTPTWCMVLALKNNEITEVDYTNMYIRRLKRLYNQDILWLRDQSTDGQLTLLCYCRDDWFCHTYVLIDYLCENYSVLFKKE